MQIEIDQSGKIENTSQLTIIADSVGNCVTLKSKDKKYLQQLFRDAEKPKMFVIETFALSVLFLIKKSFSRSNIYFIDVEYPGKNEIIKSYIIRFAKKIKISIVPEQIQFKLVGKSSKAHETAYGVFSKKVKGENVDIKVILRILLDFFE